MEKKIISNSPAETKQLAKDFANQFKNGLILCLYGNLGAGKTTFTQSLAEFLGIKRIISPTFILQRSYPIKKPGVGAKMLCHLDLYRLDNINEIRTLGIEEIMQDENNITLIEWADKLKQLLPKKRVDIYFKYLTENKREIIIKNYE